MNAQIFMMLIVGVSIIRFFKGYATRKKEFDFNDEVNGFTTHLIVVFVIYMIVYLVLSFFA